ncbi:13471_t:CDS:2 [Racocetra fulgida]|uniref:13471_t:CDS:1 n=1 Tax=Racocetra fulgida TaxID=60492 RepID=A0A9N8Z870_9GLOM|nr:13471_t:CDS:2 [Racocetra fulgida]
MNNNNSDEGGEGNNSILGLFIIFVVIFTIATFISSAITLKQKESAAASNADQDPFEYMTKFKSWVIINDYSLNRYS